MNFRHLFRLLDRHMNGATNPAFSIERVTENLAVVNGSFHGKNATTAPEVPSERYLNRTFRRLLTRGHVAVLERGSVKRRLIQRARRHSIPRAGSRLLIWWAGHDTAPNSSAVASRSSASASASND